MSLEFDRDTNLVREGPSTWRGSLADGWDIAGAPNGGYVAALMLSGMLGEVDQPDPLTTTVHFLASPKVGPVELRTSVAKKGRRYSTVRGDLVQDDRTVATAMTMATDLTAAAGDTYVDATAPSYPPPESCTRARREGMASIIAVLDRVELRFPDDLAGFASGTPSGEALVGGWARFADLRAIDSRSLAFFADTFPPAILNLGTAFGWVPTLELTVHVRSRPATEWLATRFTTRVATNGHFEEDGMMWDDNGNVVAQSRQVALLPGLA